MSDDCKAAMLEAGVPYPCAPDCPCALEIENKALRAERERLRGLLTECADDLQSYVDHEYPENIRAQYPSIDRRWHRDMGLVLRVRSALEQNRSD